MSNKAGIQGQLADAAFKTLVEATVPYCLKILDGARDLPLVNAWANRRRALGGGVLMLRYVTPDDVQIADLPRLTDESLRLFDGWQALATGGIVVILELSINEKFHTDMGQFADLAEASVPAAERVHEAGFRGGVLVTSEGNPPGPNYGADFFLQPRVLACLRAFRKVGAVWCPHSYSHPPAPADDEYHFDRPRKILERLPEDARLNYALGEMGCDGGCDLPDKKPGVGYQGYFDPDEGRIKRYAGFCRVQVARIALDPLCVAGAFFLSGHDPAGRPNFGTFDVRDEVDWRPVLTEAVPGPPITWLQPVKTPAPPASTKEVPVPDIDLSVEERLAHAVPENYQPGETFGPCIGTVWHSTGGPAGTIEGQYIGTVNWFQNPDAGVSCHRIVGGGKFNEVCTSVHDHEVANHAGAGDRAPSENRRRRGIEAAHGDGGAWDVVAYTAFQYAAIAEITARWHLADKARGWHWPIKLLSAAEAAKGAPGIVDHKDTPAGIAWGRRDPTPPFDGARAIRETLAWVKKIEAGTAATPTPKNPDPTPIPPIPGHWPNGRVIASSAEYDAHVWTSLMTAYTALMNGGNGPLGDDADAAAILAIKRKSEERHGVKR